jgi:DNA-binding PadR family transcriptional regulator
VNRVSALGPKECALLGAISAAPIHGYELVRLLRERGYEEWTELSIPTVYRRVAALERRGLVHSRTQGSDKGPLRRSYRITPAGRAALRASLLAHLREPTRGRSSFDLGVAHAMELDRTLAAQAIRARRLALDDRYRGMVERRNAQRAAAGSLPWNVEALFLHGELLYRAECEYLEHLLKQYGQS